MKHLLKYQTPEALELVEQVVVAIRNEAIKWTKRADDARRIPDMIDDKLNIIRAARESGDTEDFIERVLRHVEFHDHNMYPLEIEQIATTGNRTRVWFN